MAATRIVCVIVVLLSSLPVSRLLLSISGLQEKQSVFPAFRRRKVPDALSWEVPDGDCLPCPRVDPGGRGAFRSGDFLHIYGKRGLCCKIHHRPSPLLVSSRQIQDRTIRLAAFGKKGG